MSRVSRRHSFPFEAFTFDCSIAKENGLELLFQFTFPRFYVNYRTNPEFNRLLERMHVRAESFSDEERHVIGKQPISFKVPPFLNPRCVF